MSRVIEELATVLEAQAARLREVAGGGAVDGQVWVGVEYALREERPEALGAFEAADLAGSATGAYAVGVILALDGERELQQVGEAFTRASERGSPAGAVLLWGLTGRLGTDREGRVAAKRRADQLGIDWDKIPMSARDRKRLATAKKLRDAAHAIRNMTEQP